MPKHEKTHGGCCLERFGPERLQNPRGVLLGEVWMWAQSIQNESFSIRFRDGLDGSLFSELSDNLEKG